MNQTPDFHPLPSGLIVPEHVADTARLSSMNSSELNPTVQEMHAQQHVLGEVVGPEGPLGSLRIENVKNDAENQKAARAIDDMLAPQNILDLKSRYDGRLARLHDEAAKRHDSAPVNEQVVKDSLIEEYVQIGAAPDKPRVVPEIVRQDIARTMDLPYDQLEQKIAQPKVESVVAAEPAPVKAEAATPAEPDLIDTIVEIMGYPAEWAPIIRKNFAAAHKQRAETQKLAAETVAPEPITTVAPEVKRKREVLTQNVLRGSRFMVGIIANGLGLSPTIAEEVGRALVKVSEEDSDKPETTSQPNTKKLVVVTSVKSPISKTAAPERLAA